MPMDFDVIIGFETHVELKTQTKLFCSCAVDYEASPNSRICPVCTGQPGALPVLALGIAWALLSWKTLPCHNSRSPSRS